MEMPPEDSASTHRDSLYWSWPWPACPTPAHWQPCFVTSAFPPAPKATNHEPSLTYQLSQSDSWPGNFERGNSQRTTVQQPIQLQNHDISQSWQPPRLKRQKSGDRRRGRVLYQQVERGQHRGAAEPLSLTLEARAIMIQDVPPAAHAELGVCC